GAYQTPLTLQEIAAYNLQGQPISPSKYISYSVGFNGTLPPLNGTNVPVRADTLSLWSLDSAHALWVKLPDSHPLGSSVIGPVSQFTAYSLMGGAEINTSDVFVY